MKILDNYTTLHIAIVFVLINFVVSSASDIVLNDLSTHYGFVSSLSSYFKNQSIILCAISAGITVVSALLLNMIVSYFLLGFVIPTNAKQLLYFCILAFVLGYGIDVWIYKMKIFGNRLDPYYKKLGAGLWGAIAFVFSIVISYFIQQHVRIS